MRLLVGFLLVFLSGMAAAIPMTLVDSSADSGRIYIPCKLDGSRRQCLLDTGSQFNFIKRDAFSMKLPILSVTSVGGASGIPQNCDGVIVRQVQAGADSFGLGRFVRCAAGEAGDLFGIPFLKKHLVHFDFNRAELTVATPAEASPDMERLEVFASGHFAVAVEVQGARGLAVWDTGAEMTVVDPELVAAQPDAFEALPDTFALRDANGISIGSKGYLAKELIVGKQTFKNVKVMASDLGTLKRGMSTNIKMVIGYNLLSHSNWTFDLKNHLWKVE